MKIVLDEDNFTFTEQEWLFYCKRNFVFGVNNLVRNNYRLQDHAYACNNIA